MTRDESGQLMVLTIGLALVVFAVAGLAVDGTKAFLARRALQHAADAATVAAASEVDVRTYYRSGGATVRLDAGDAERVAARVLAARGLSAITAIEADETSVAVVLRSESRTTFLRLAGIEVIPVAAEARAEPLPQPVAD